MTRNRARFQSPSDWERAEEGVSNLFEKANAPKIARH